MKRWIGLIVIAVLWGIGLTRWHGLLPCAGQVFLDYGEGAGPEKMQFEQMTDQARETAAVLPELAAWSLVRDVEVENRSLGRVCRADCMEVYGSRELAASRRVIQGNYGYASDREACVISRGLAQELLGSDAVTGKYLWCKGRDYVVRGVMEDNGRVIVIPAEERGGGMAGGSGAAGSARTGAGGGSRLRYVLLDFGGASGGASGAEQLLFRYGIENARYSVDGSVCLAAAGFFVFLPLCVALVRGLIILRRRILQAAVEDRRARVISGAVFAAACAAAAGILTGAVLLLGAAGTRFPQELIPTRWSDFGFWSRSWRKILPSLLYSGEPGRIMWLKLLRKRTVLGVLCPFLAALLAALRKCPQKAGHCKEIVIDTWRQNE